MVQERRHAGGGHPMPQKVNKLDTKNTFLQVNHKSMLSQPEEELPEMPGVFLLVLAGHLQVIEVPEDRLEVGGGAVYFPLEGGSRIHQTKRHPQKLKVSEWCSNSSFLYISRVHRYLMVTFTQINFTENLAPSCLNCEIHHIRQGVSIRDGHSIEQPEIAAQPPLAVRLLDHM
jgi:hypothetical protein